jgi:chorismate synthase
MSANTFGELFKVTTFGESHGLAMGVVLDGVPAGIPLSEEDVQPFLERRRPGQSEVVSPRQEKDRCEIVSGIYGGKTLGTPICVIIRNEDARSADYAKLQETKVFRPSHHDQTFFEKFGVFAPPGGGRLSARETCSRVIAGAVAQSILQKGFSLATEVLSFTTSIGTVTLEREQINTSSLSSAEIETSLVRCPSMVATAAMRREIDDASKAGDSVGGVIRTLIRGIPKSLGEPVFDKFDAVLAHAMMSLPASKGFSIGKGFDAAQMRGSIHNDTWTVNDLKKPVRKSNHSGGAEGGMTTGEVVDFSVAFKPVSTLQQTQQALSSAGEVVPLDRIGGRHDPCVIPRAVPIVEAMTWVVILDCFLLHRARSIN